MRFPTIVSLRHREFPITVLINCFIFAVMKASNDFYRNMFGQCFGPVTRSLEVREVDLSVRTGRYGVIRGSIVLAIGPRSLDMYDVGSDVSEFTGLSREDALSYNESPSDAFVYGMANVMNGGSDIFFFTNGTRLAYEARKNGMCSAVMEQVSHECVHLARLFLTRHILGGSRDWTKSAWPSIGDGSDDIDEETFAEAVGYISMGILKDFMDMASVYVPNLSGLMS